MLSRFKNCGGLCATGDRRTGRPKKLSERANPKAARMPGLTVAALVAAAALAVFAAGLSFACSPSAPHGWRPVWSDEFDYEGLPDQTRWSYDTDGNAWDWGNREAQFYTSREPANAYVSDGVLRITALRQQAGGKEYTSARLRTMGKGDWLYGRIDVRAKLPTGRGAWSAIWMLPTDWEYGGWPDSGEIDIMENVGFDGDTVVSTAHTRLHNHSNGTSFSGKLYLPTADSEFHVYTLEWDEDEWRSYVDGELYYTYTREDGGSAQWPFDKRFHLLLNLAVGGTWGGLDGIDEDAFPMTFTIDYVRVYERDGR